MALNKSNVASYSVGQEVKNCHSKKNKMGQKNYTYIYISFSKFNERIQYPREKEHIYKAIKLLKATKTKEFSFMK